MRKRGRAFIIGIGIMMAAAALSGCGKKAEEAAVTTEAPTVMPEETKTIVLETEPTTEATLESTWMRTESSAATSSGKVWKKKPPRRPRSRAASEL